MIGILVSVVIGLIVNECCDVSPWCARKLVQWSAYRRYTDPGRAAERAEELAALIDERPGKLLKLFTALGFAGSAILVAYRRTLARPAAPALENETLQQDAAVTALLLSNVGPVIAALEPAKDAVIQVGALLIVKADWAVRVHRLTAGQQYLLGNNPSLAASPDEIFAVPNLPSSSENEEVAARIDERPGKLHAALGFAGSAILVACRRPRARRAARALERRQQDLEKLLQGDATVTALLMENLAPVIAALAPNNDAVVRMGALLIVKADGAVQVHQLTSRQQVLLDDNPSLARSPGEIIAALSFEA